MASAFDFEECYPVIGHAPYWTILFGFFSSTILTYITLIGGNGLFSVLKSCICLCCKCCCIKSQNANINLNASNNWKIYPEIINIANSNPFKKIISAKRVFGYYLINKDEDIPFYQSALQTAKGNLCYYLKYVKHPSYNGWILASDPNIKFKMIQQQNQSLSDESDDFELELNPNNLEKSLLDDSYNDDEKALNMLNKKMQKFTLYTKNEIDLGKEFCINNVSHSEFIKIYTNNPSTFNAKNHWVAFEGFDVYKHNVLQDEIFDLNGKYELYSFENDKDGNCLKFGFQHKQNEHLICAVIADCNESQKVSGKQRILIYHVTDLCFENNGEGLIDLRMNLSEETELKNSDEIDSAIKYDFNGKEEIIIKVSGISGCGICCSQLIEILFALMGGYQLVIDILYFVDYLKNSNVSSWQKYECYCYIISNSTNMKQLFVFILSWILSGVKVRGNKIKLFFWFLYLLLIIPGFITHIIPFIGAYIWIMLIVGCCACSAVFNCSYQYRVNHDLNILAILISIIAALMVYFSLILWPVASMTRLYNGDDYIDSIYSVFNDRKTADYIAHFVDNYHCVTQFALWVL